ncbi:hypothetical protein JCM10207_002375 [Rhodosporidiobolus poonsookiae]
MVAAEDQLLSSRTLPTAAALPRHALHPLHSLVALLSPPSTTTDPRVTLLRTSAQQAAPVWEYTPPPPPAPPPTGKGLLALKAKKQQQPAGTIDHLEWSTDGQVLAVVVSPPPSSSLSPSLILLSLHSGLPLPPSPIALPTPASTCITHLAWHALPPPSPAADQPTLHSWALDLIAHLPGLPKIPKEGVPSAGGPGAPGASGLLGPGGGPGGGGGGAGVFGAKQAMLERERAKEAQRALSLADACGGAGAWPTLVPVERGDGALSETGDEKVRAMMRVGRGEGAERSVLCVGDDEGRVHLYLGGSVFLGSFPLSLSTAANIASTSLLPSASSFTLHTHLLAASALSIIPLHIPLPPTLQLVLRVSSALRACVAHAFEALQEARGLWDEARRLGKGWVQRVADTARPHGVTTPAPSLLLALLLTGRPHPALLDFLSSKLNARGLDKWDVAMGVALARLRGIGWMSLRPAMERVVVLLMEVEGWSWWPRFSAHPLPPTPLHQALALAQETIKVAARFQLAVEDEERCFVQFGRWVRYELDRALSADVDPLPRVSASFAPLPAAHYLRCSLPATSTTLAPFLAMGLASAPLAGNEHVARVEGWVEARSTPTEGEQGSRSAERGRLDHRLKRMKEELAGQLQSHEVASSRSAARVAAQDAAQAKRRAADPFGLAELERDLEADLAADAAAGLRRPSFAAPAADPDAGVAPPSSAAAQEKDQREGGEPLQSLPAMLHVLARLCGGIMDRAVRGAVGEVELEAQGEQGEGKASVGEEVRRDARGEGEEVRVRSRARTGQGKGLVQAWVRGGTVRFARSAASSSSIGPALDLASTEHAAYSLSTADGATLKVIELELLDGGDGGDDVEAVFGFEVAKEGAPSKYLIATLPLSSLSWHSSTPASSSLPPLPLTPPSRTHPLDAHYPPSSLAFGVLGKGGERKRERVVASLAGEGRRFEVRRWEADGAAGGAEGKRGDVEMR